MNIVNNYLKKYISNIVGIFLIVSPFLDLITSLGIRYINENFTFGMIIRFLFLLLLIYYSIFVNKDNKKQNIILLSTMTIYFIITMLLLYTGVDSIFYEMKVFLKSFYYIILMICFYDLKAKINQKYIFITFSVYILLIFVPNMLNIGFDSYEITKIGNVGWFYAANEIGTILAILLPLSINYVLKNYNKIFIFLYLIITLYTLGSIGTKVPILSLFITVFYYVILYVFKNFKEKKWLNIFLTLIVAFIGFICSIVLIPKTNFYKNIEIHLNYLEIENVTDILTNYKLIDHFVFGSRFKLFNNNINLIDNNIDYLTGIGASHRQCEMDFLDIFINYGVLGLALMIFLIIYLLYKENPKFNQHIFLSVFLGTIIALTSGHVLVAPAVGIYIALLLLNKVEMC